MLCPKCGFDQPEENECARCGVVFAKYISVLKKKEEIESKFSPPPIPVDTAMPDLANGEPSNMADEVKRMAIEIAGLKTDRSVLKDEVVHLKKRADSLTQAISTCVPFSKIQDLAKEVAPIMEQFNVLKTSVLKVREGLENAKRMALESKQLLPEVEKTRVDLAKVLQMLKGIEEAKATLNLLTMEIEKMKKDKKKELPSDAGSKGAINELKQEIDTIKSELRVVMKSKEGDSQSARLTGDLSILRKEVELLRSELGKLSADKEKTKRTKSEHLMASDDLIVLREELSVLRQDRVRLEQIEGEILGFKEAWSRVGQIEEQLAQLKSCVNGSSSKNESSTGSDISVGMKELRDDVRAVKVLLTDLVKRG